MRTSASRPRTPTGAAWIAARSSSDSSPAAWKSARGWRRGSRAARSCEKNSGEPESSSDVAGGECTGPKVFDTGRPGEGRIQGCRRDRAPRTNGGDYRMRRGPHANSPQARGESHAEKVARRREDICFSFALRDDRQIPAPVLLACEASVTLSYSSGDSSDNPERAASDALGNLGPGRTPQGKQQANRSRR